MAALRGRLRPERVTDKVGWLTRERIRKATAMLAAGETYESVAKQLHVAPAGVHEWRKLHPDLWREEYARAIEAAIVVVCRLAGTAAIAGDPERFIRQAMRCEKWLAKQGEPLFPRPEEVTLTSFYETCCKPNRLTDAVQSTRDQFDGLLRKWRLFTGDPLLQQITIDTLNQLRTCLQKLAGKDRVSRLSPNTVRTQLKAVQILLDKCGPPGPRNRDAAGLLQKVPWIKPPAWVSSRRPGGGHCPCWPTTAASAGGRSSSCGWSGSTGTTTGSSFLRDR